jgi:hypothetical protein
MEWTYPLFKTKLQTQICGQYINGCWCKSSLKKYIVNYRQHPRKMSGFVWGMAKEEGEGRSVVKCSRSVD